MKVLVEAMCADFGGIRTYVENLLDAWPRVYPEDELHVLVHADSPLPTPEGVTRHEVAVPRPAVFGRPVAQTRHTTRLVRSERPDVVLATLPATTVRRAGVPMALVIYDLRHELRPKQFSIASRLLRRISYGRSYRIADSIISISQRSLDDLYELHPRLRTKPGAVAHLGADHVLSWPTVQRNDHAVTFAHHSNKNLDLTLDAWKLLNDRGAVPPLVVLGLSGDSRTHAEVRLRDLGLDSVVSLAPFLPDEEFQRVFASARVVVFPSDFEGFGLPVVEAMLLGSPVVIGPEPATQEVAGGRAVVMRDWTTDALAEAVESACALSPEALDGARTHAQSFTWAATVHRTRERLQQLTGAT